MRGRPLVSVLAAIGLLALLAAGGARSFTVGWLPDSRLSGTSADQAATSRPLLTAIYDSPPVDPAGGAAFGAHARATGARFIRLPVRWRLVAPGGTSKPAGFDARNPGDPKYLWSDIDEWIRVAMSHGLTPILFVYTAPAWAESGVRARATDGPVQPSVSDYRDFLTAIATRYSGGYGDLPRVRYWQVWNEPNLDIFLTPQFVNGAPASPELYREMVNATAQAVHAVHRDNVVVAGGLAPFGGSSNDPTAGNHDEERVRPLQFMRDMLCVSGGADPRPTCNEKTEFDVWSHHPYTYGGPTHNAFHPDDVSLGDLGEMRKLLVAAKRAGHVQGTGDVGFWVTEFSYDSKPGDPKGLSPALHARWVSEAMYRMWANGVTLVTWFLIRDEPFPQGMFQSGLYTRGTTIAADKPKPALRAFRFPFVAFRSKGGAVTFWGRTPAGVRKGVVVEQKSRSGVGWRTLVLPPVDRYGIFSGRIPSTRGTGSLRARLIGGRDASVPFSLTVAKDFRFCPWGSFC